MSYGPVTQISKNYQMQADMLKAVAAALKAAAMALKMSLFGAIMFAEVIRRFELVAKKSENLAKLCEEFSNDLARAVDDHKKGDYKAATYFGEGVR
jgi:hypothetical protein